MPLAILDRVRRSSPTGPDELSRELAILTEEAATLERTPRVLRRRIAKTSRLLIETTGEQDALTPEALALIEYAIETTGEIRLARHALNAVQGLPPLNFHRRIIETVAADEVAPHDAALKLIKEGELEAGMSLADETFTQDSRPLGPAYDFLFNPEIAKPEPEKLIGTKAGHVLYTAELGTTQASPPEQPNTEVLEKVS